MSTQFDASNDELTERILGVAIDVHRELGSAESEATYKKALEIGLDDEGLDVSVEHAFEQTYRGEAVSTGFIDILVEEQVVLELKSVKRTTRAHFNQLGRNVQAVNATRGLLLNFGEPTLGITRYINSKAAE